MDVREVWIWIRQKPNGVVMFMVGPYALEYELFKRMLPLMEKHREWEGETSNFVRCHPAGQELEVVQDLGSLPDPLVVGKSTRQTGRGKISHRVLIGMSPEELEKKFLELALAK